MKKLLRTLVAVATLITLTPFVVGAPVSAQAKCEIGYTGPDSENMCTSTTQYVCTVTNTNDITITNTNGQQAYSGSVTTTGNTTGGGTASGTVTNSNGTVFNVTIKNDPVVMETKICEATTRVPATEEPEVPVTPVTPVRPVGGLGAANVPAPVVLPNTSSASEAVNVLIVVVGSIAALVSMLGALAYRQLKQ